MKQFRTMSLPYILWMAVMIVLPMLLIVMYAFTVKGNSVTTFRFTLENFSDFFKDAVFLEVLERSLAIAAATTILCVLIGYPAAYIIANSKGRQEVMLILLITMPTWSRFF